MELLLRGLKELSDLDLGDTIITSADDKIKMKGADLIWSNLANN